LKPVGFFDVLAAVNDPVLALGLLAFGLLLVALPLAFWSVSGEATRSVTPCACWWRRESEPYGPAHPALVGIGPFPDQQSLRVALLPGLACTLTQLLVERSWPSPLVPAAATPMGLGLPRLRQLRSA